MNSWILGRRLTSHNGAAADFTPLITKEQKESQKTAEEISDIFSIGTNEESSRRFGDGKDVASMISLNRTCNSSFIIVIKPSRSTSAANQRILDLQFQEEKEIVFNS